MHNTTQPKPNDQKLTAGELESRGVSTIVFVKEVTASLVSMLS
jgi:hypothetical protein